MKHRIFLWSTIYNRLLSKGIDGFEIDIRYLDRWIKKYPECFPRFMLENNYTATFNWKLLRWEIKCNLKTK